nr:probable molybdenum cofactor guanylyltransferase [Nerophis lumbriciformis]
MSARLESSAVGVVLAGGASRRLGRDKALIRLPSSGETLVESAARRLGEVCSEVVVADRGRCLVAGLASVEDGLGAGPAAAILGAAGARPGRSLLVLACDLPRVPPSLLRRLVEQPAVDGPAADLRLPRWQGGLEPLAAFYGPAALEILAARVVQGHRALHPLARESGLRTYFLTGAQLQTYGEPADVFLNVNRPDDLARLRGLLDYAGSDKATTGT